MIRAQCGDWVEISTILLQPHERSKNIPPETSCLPLTMRTNGFAVSEAAPGEQITIRTFTSRQLTGTLLEINPSFKHNFGNCVPELNTTRMNLKQTLHQS